MRQPAARIKPRTASLQTFPAPIGGWIKNQSLLAPNARRPDGTKVNGAFVLENMFPEATTVRMRAGSDLYATVGDGSEDVVSFLTYVNGNNRSLFASTETAVYDVTSPVIAFNLVDHSGNFLTTDTGDHLILFPDSEIAPVVDSLGGGFWVGVQFADADGDIYLRAVNGIDTPIIYDGATWGTTPAITFPVGAGVTANDLSYVWVYKQRLFFIQKDSLDAWYLPVNALGGELKKLPMGGVFARGGSLMFGETWSLESGAGGLSEQCVFITTEGEVAVYQGADPDDADTWSKVGVYRIGKPLGPQAHIRAGGDLVISTDVGFVPLSTAVQRDFAALSPAAVSYNIEVAWNEAVANRSLSDWHCEVWPTKQMVLIALPTPIGTQAQMLVANSRTGAWGLYTGWDGRCVQLFGDRLFFGSANGKVIEAEITGLDQGNVYTSVCVPLFDPLKSPASMKTGLLVRATVLSSQRVTPQVSLQNDFVVSLPAPPDSIAVVGSNLWGVGIWGQSVWSAQVAKLTFQEWQSAPGSGYALAPAMQVTSGSLSPPDVELVSIDLTFELADIVT